MLSAMGGPLELAFETFKPGVEIVLIVLQNADLSARVRGSARMGHSLDPRPRIDSERLCGIRHAILRMDIIGAVFVVRLFPSRVPTPEPEIDEEGNSPE